MPRKYLVIESFERLLELANTKAFIDLLLFLNKQQGWVIIATGRNYAYQVIAFNYLQPFGVNFVTLKLNGFSDNQVQILCDQIEPLQKFADNATLRQLLKSPFLADIAFRILETGTEFTPEDGEREFRAAVWRDVIAKEQIRLDGMPLRRRQTFMNIAVKRAKQMAYGVPEIEFDSGAMLKLEEDNLVRRDSKNGLVSPAHDVLEDWALEQYIDDAFQRYSSSPENFLNVIGNEPAINRAFRLWLHQKLKYGDSINDFVRSILINRDIQRYWQDETIAAVLQGKEPNTFLELLKDQILSGEGELLKRFCFILRIACQSPDETVSSKLKEDEKETLVDTLFLKPYGSGWKAIICFLFNNKDHIPDGLLPHVAAVLNDWMLCAPY